jgi:hypothetical protein
MSAVLAPARLSTDDAGLVLQRWIAEGEATDARMMRAGPGGVRTRQPRGEKSL